MATHAKLAALCGELQAAAAVGAPNWLKLIQLAQQLLAILAGLFPAKPAPGVVAPVGCPEDVRCCLELAASASACAKAHLDHALSCMP